MLLTASLLFLTVLQCFSFHNAFRVMRPGPLSVGSSRAGRSALASAISDDSILASKLFFSENAMKRVRKLLTEQEGSKILRVSLTGGGDEGDYIEWKYRLEFDDVSVTQDKEKYALFQDSDDWNYIVDREYLPLIANCKIDYIDDILKGGFKFKNPQAAGTCGCAASFTTDTDRKFVNNVLTKTKDDK